MCQQSADRTPGADLGDHDLRAKQVLIKPDRVIRRRRQCTNDTAENQHPAREGLTSRNVKADIAELDAGVAEIRRRPGDALTTDHRDWLVQKNRNQRLTNRFISSLSEYGNEG